MLGIHKQLVWRIGVKLQDLAMQSLRGSSKLHGFGVQKIDWDDIFDVRSKIDPKLAKYVQAAKRLTRGHQFFGMCADKAACGGFNLKPGC